LRATPCSECRTSAWRSIILSSCHHVTSGVGLPMHVNQEFDPVNQSGIFNLIPVSGE
jgi:hypothetical protein